jgi:hypothetical protein
MNTNDDGGPAFSCDAGNGKHQRGMSLRDWYAGMAMQGLTSYINEHEDHYTSALKGAAKTSYDIADAMLAARKETLS